MGYCNQVLSPSVCLSVCLCVIYQNLLTINKIETSTELPTDMELYKDQNQIQAVSKTLSYDKF